ncbi:MAG: porin family protein [Steroidobacteraceae bacterium]
MKALTHIVLLGALAAVPAMSNAAEKANPTGPYVGGSVGRFNLNVEHLDDVDDAVQTIRDSNDNAWKVFAGYRFLPYLGIEAAYIDFGNPGDRFDTSGSDGNYDVKLSGFAPSLIGTVPLGPVELFAKIGQYYYDVDTRIDLDNPGPDIRTSHSRNDFLWGGGVSVVVLSRLELRAEYEKVEIENAKDSDAMWLGAAWRF